MGYKTSRLLHLLLVFMAGAGCSFGTWWMLSRPVSGAGPATNNTTMSPREREIYGLQRGWRLLDVYVTPGDLADGKPLIKDARFGSIKDVVGKRMWYFFKDTEGWLLEDSLITAIENKPFDPDAE